MSQDFAARNIGKEETTRMSAQVSNDKNSSFETDAYYEEQARQEEIYLEETEEELRLILELDDSLYCKVRVLISDDPSLSEEAAENMPRMS
jgi:hypothetical protein